jgi:hypothetical protein
MLIGLWVENKKHATGRSVWQGLLPGISPPFAFTCSVAPFPVLVERIVAVSARPNHLGKVRCGFLILQKHSLQEFLISYPYC